jgi:hypothetical protein
MLKKISGVKFGFVRGECLMNINRRVKDSDGKLPRKLLVCRRTYCHCYRTGLAIAGLSCFSYYCQRKKF